MASFHQTIQCPKINSDLLLSMFFLHFEHVCFLNLLQLPHILFQIHSLEPNTIENPNELERTQVKGGKCFGKFKNGGQEALSLWYYYKPAHIQEIMVQALMVCWRSTEWTGISALELCFSHIVLMSPLLTTLSCSSHTLTLPNLSCAIFLTALMTIINNT